MNWKKLQNGSDIRGVALEGIEGEHVNLTPEVIETKSPASSSSSSSLFLPLGRVPASGYVLKFPFSSLTSVSGEAPAISISSEEK